MILQESFSEVGRATAQHLDNLRRQLGVGIDPAYDYSQMTELQKKLTSKKDKKPKDDGQGGSGALDKLRDALREATNPPGQGEETEQDGQGAAGSPGKLGGSQQLGQKGKVKPSWSFKTQPRQSLYKLDIENRFRAPPVGCYRPKVEVCERRSQECDFGYKEPTRSFHTVKLEEEVNKLKEEGKPFEHLLKPCTTVEVLEERPERLRPRLSDYSFSKSIDRPDPVKSAGITYHDNSFSAGVLDGDLNTSKLERKPEWDFARTSTSEAKPRETFFQPGQYNVNVNFTRPTADVKNIPFSNQTKRKPLRESVGRVEIKSRAGDHLPDRSHTRSCPLLSKFRNSSTPSFDKYTERPPLAKIMKPYHDAEDPEVDQAVFHRSMTHDEMEAAKSTWSKAKTVEKFDISLTRQEQFKVQRMCGENIPLQRAKENLTRGPVSVELLPEIGNSPSLKPKILVKDFDRMPARHANEKRYVEPPPRNRDLSDAMRFERGTRGGDARPEAGALSPVAGTISKLRATRKYSSLDVGKIAE